MNVTKALDWLIKNESQELRVNNLGQRVTYNGQLINIRRSGYKPSQITVVQFLATYRREKFTLKWSLLNYYQRQIGERRKPKTGRWSQLDHFRYQVSDNVNAGL